MELKDAEAIVGRFEEFATEAVTETERCLSEHRHYNSAQTLRRVRLSCKTTADCIAKYEAEAQALQELKLGGPLHRLRMPKETRVEVERRTA